MRWPTLLVGLAALCVVLGAGQVGAQTTLGAPTITSLTATTNTLTVSWSAPSETGGATITAYDVHYILSSATDKTVDANWTLKEDRWTTGGGGLTYELRNLPDGVGYDVGVRAVANGDGPWSAPLTGATNDHGGTRATATALSPGSSLPSRLEPATDVDVFSITLAADGDLWVYATGELDTVGELLDSDGELLKSNDDGTLLDSPLGFGIRREVDRGTYYVRVSSFNERSAGAYTIHARTVGDPRDDLSVQFATLITPGSVTPGRIGPTGGENGDTDVFRLHVPTTADIWITAVGTNDIFGGDLDTVGELLFTTGTAALTNDDSGLAGNFNGFAFRARLTGPSNWFIRVTTSSRFDVGPYTLHVRTSAQPGSTTATAAPLTLRIPETGEITSSSDRDYFRLTLAVDTYVYIYALNLVGTRLPLTPTVLDDQGATVSIAVIPNALYTAHGEPEVGFWIWGHLDAGTYHIRISGARGKYLLDSGVSYYGPVLERCTGLTTPQSDPWYGCQWHLNNTGQFDGGAMQDINVESVWAGGNKGEGINTVVVDDGLQTDHEDLIANVLAARNHDYSGRGSVSDPLQKHGTFVAGLIAARDNTLGVRGVAPRAKIFSYNLTSLGSVVSDSAADAMYRSEDAQQTAVSNNSWGFTDNGVPRTPDAAWELAVERGVTSGYGGKGTFYAWAGGNGHLQFDNSNLDGRANFYAVTAVCAVGYDDVRSGYSEMGANLWICAPSDSVDPDLPEITSTDTLSRYDDTFGGTSAATPIVSGVAALVRAANTNLTWRDVKLILAASARKNDAANSGWQTGALKYGSTSERYQFNHEYGFGMVDAAAAVTLANDWTNVPLTMRSIESESGALNLALPDAPEMGDPSTVTSALTLDSYVGFAEFVEIEVELEHTWFRDLQIELVSPTGAVSVLSVPASFLLVEPRAAGAFDGTHRFGSARHLGENAAGTWTLRVSDQLNLDTGTLKSWKLKVYGHGFMPGYVQAEPAVPGPGALTVSWTAPVDTGGPAITSYDLRYILEDDLSAGAWTEVTNVGSTSSLQDTVTGLEGEKKYLVAIRAVNDAGAGPWSDSSSVETESVIPGQPTSLTVAARNLGLAVSWREPGYVGAGPITSYDVRYIREDAADKADPFWTPLTNAWTTGNGDLRYVIRSLEDGVEYDVQVRARNSRTEGEWTTTARKGTPEDINSAAEFPGTETGRRSVDENTAADVNIGDPVAARDDEGDTRTYSLGSGDDLFDIVATSGQLQTEAALNHEAASSHAVTVRVHDGKDRAGAASTATDDSIRVTVMVEGVEEPPGITGDAAIDYAENGTGRVGRYSATDPENKAVTWLPLTGDDAGFFFFSDSGELTFSNPPDFEALRDNTYEVTVRARDEGGEIGELPVTVTVTPVNEPPAIRGEANTAFDENDTRSVGRYSAQDPEGASSTWEALGGADAGHFELDEFSQLRFVAPPDFEARADANRDNTYEVTVRASDADNFVGALKVRVTVLRVDEPPIVGGPATITVNEGHTGTLGTYTKRDPDGETTNWARKDQTAALSGADAGRFAFDKNTGKLAFASPPDYEADGAQHLVTVNANDGTLDGAVDVTVNVTNVDEPGKLKFDKRTPVINLQIVATLADPDNVVSTTWAWERSTSRSSGWMAISGASRADYVPTGEDRNHYLRVTANYIDGHGSAEPLQATTEFTTANVRMSNRPPVFPDTVPDLSIPENTPPGRNVGSPLEASDSESDPLTYSLTGANEFVVGSTTGQIQVAPGADLDFESGRTSFSVTVTADDDFGGTDTVDVAINITGVNEAPKAEDYARSTQEDEATTITVLTDDTDPEGDDLTVSVRSGPSKGAATAQADNTIIYTPRADYHGADSFIYQVSDGSFTDAARVTITVNWVNDAPTFASPTATRSVSERAEASDNVGAPVTAMDVDENDTLTYSLSGSTDFEIEEGTGQIMVAPGAVLDASQPTHTVSVTADDGNRMATVVVTITVRARPVRPPIIITGPVAPRGPTPSAEDFEWTVSRDIEELDGGNDWPTGLWSDGATLWLAENGQGADDEVYAYDIESGERVEEREFELAETNRAPRGFWSDRETVWVSDSGQDRLFAYDLASGERVAERELELPRDNRDPRGIWSDGETIWVLDGRADALFAYDLAGGELLGEYALDAANDDPHGIWSDHVTVWVSNHDPKRLFAYRLPTPEGPAAEDADAIPLERVRDEEFTELSRASNNSPRGIWSDGEVMYVADESDDKVYSYNMPDAIDARLASLALSDVEIGEFSPGRTEYEGVVAQGVTETTVVAEAVQPGAAVVIEPADADEDADGHQVALAGVAEITVTVTSEDGSRTRVYRVRLAEPAPAADCLRGAVASGFSLVVSAGGSVEELETCAQSRHVTALHALHDGEYVSYILGAQEFVNREFSELYPDGLPALTPLIAKSEGPPSADPAAGSGDIEPWPECLRGGIASGFSLVLYEGGSVEELASCAASRDVSAVYALRDGEYVPYILGAPAFVNAQFVALFPAGVPAVTPLITRSDGQASASSDPDAAARN